MIFSKVACNTFTTSSGQEETLLCFGYEDEHLDDDDWSELSENYLCHR